MKKSSMAVGRTNGMRTMKSFPMNGRRLGAESSNERLLNAANMGGRRYWNESSRTFACAQTRHGNLQMIVVSLIILRAGVN